MKSKLIINDKKYIENKKYRGKVPDAMIQIKGFCLHDVYLFAKLYLVHKVKYFLFRGKEPYITYVYTRGKK